MMRYAAIWSIGTLLSSLLEGGEAFHLPAAVTRKVSSTSLSSSNVPIIGDLEAPQASESKGQLSDEEWQKLPDAPGKANAISHTTMCIDLTSSYHTLIGPRQWPLVGNMITLLRLGGMSTGLINTSLPSYKVSLSISIYLYKQLQINMMHGYTRNTAL